ncbi:hypothetical protein BD770DRAFT_334370, partial [Pilaira anomala]
MDTNEENSTGPTLLTQPYPDAPTLSHKDIILPTANDIIHNIDSNGNVTKNINNNKIRAIKKVSPLSERISYDITEDVLNRKADIVVKDLLIAAPSLKRELIKSVRNKTSLVNIPPMTLAFAEDDDVDTTAIYTDVYIGQTKFKAILDTGSAKTVISRKLAEALNLTIDTPSTSVFTLGNGSRQAALGLIYDVPINLGGKIIIPGSIEVLPECPTQLIIGNNWLKRAKAKLNLDEKFIKVEYKGIKAHIPFIFTKASKTINNIKAHPVKYTNNDDNRITQNTIDPNVYENNSEDNASDIDPEEDDSDTDELVPDSSDKESQGDLFMLEDTYGEKEDIDEEFIIMEDNPSIDNNYIIKFNRPFYLSPYSQTCLFIQPLNVKPKELNQHKYILQITNKKLYDRESVWQPSSSYLQQTKKNLIIHLINNSENSIEFESKDILGELDIINYDDIEDMDCYKICKQNLEEMECMYQDPDYQQQDKNTMDEYEKKILDKIDISTTPTAIKNRYLELMQQYDHIFDWDNNKIGNIDIMEHSIKLKADAVPKRVRPYRLSPLETESLRNELEKLLKLGIIEKGGYSEWSSPIIMLKKKDGTYRIV